VVVDRHRQDLFGVILPDDVSVELGADLVGFGQARAFLGARLLHFIADDVVAEFDALIADKHRGPRNQFAYLVLALAAE